MVTFFRILSFFAFSFILLLLKNIYLFQGVQIIFELFWCFIQFQPIQQSCLHIILSNLGSFYVSDQSVPIRTTFVNLTNLVDMAFYAISKKGCLSMVTFFRISSFFYIVIHFSTFYKSSRFLRSSRIFLLFLSVLFYLYSISFFISVHSINLGVNSWYFSLIWSHFISLFDCLFIKTLISFPLVWWIWRFMQSVKKGA